MSEDLATVTLQALEFAVSWLRHDHGDHGPGSGCWKCAALHDELDQVEHALADAVDQVFDGADLEVAA